MGFTESTVEAVEVSVPINTVNLHMGEVHL